MKSTNEQMRDVFSKEWTLNQPRNVYRPCDEYDLNIVLCVQQQRKYNVKHEIDFGFIVIKQ